MAYTVNGKVYTTHPLMDEIVYNTKKILSQIVIKNDDLATQYEDEESLSDYEIMLLEERDNLNFDTFPFTEKYYKAYGFGTSDIRIYLDDRYAIPEDIRNDLVAFSIDYFHRTFEERNDYYRTFLGLPPFDTNQDYWIPFGDRTNGRIGYGGLIPISYIRAKTDSEGHVDIDKTLPLHLQTKELINVLQDCGAIDKLRVAYKGSNYSYILYLKDKSLDLLEMRKAKKWDILYMPKVEALVQDRFEEIYYLNRDKYLKDYYQEAYKYESKYYDQTMIILLLCQTFNDLIVDVPEWYIRRDIFDIRSVQYFLDSYGVEFFPEIPLKYQIKIVKNLNKLIKYKSTNRNTEDILDIFGLAGTTIYKYYLFKRRVADGKGYVDSDDPEKAFELLFVATELGDNYDNYIKDNIYQTPYDDITLQDKYWDGEQTHAYVRKQHLEKDFTLEGTKYMSVEYKVSLEEYLKQQQYFVGLMFSSHIDMDDFAVIIPAISETTRIKVSNLFLFLLALSDAYEGIEQTLDIPDGVQPGWDLPDLGIDKYYHIVNAGDPDTEVTNESYVYNYTNKVETSRIMDHKSINMIDAEAGKVYYTEYKSVEDLLDWKKYWYDRIHLGDNYIYPGMYETEKYRIYGFNNVDKDQISNIISQRHSMFGFSRGYTLEEFGLDKYINPDDVDINTAEDLIDLYNTNIAIYEDLKDRISNNWYSDTDKIEAYNHDDLKVMEYLFHVFFTKEYDRDFYLLNNGEYASKYADMLKDRDFTLYNLYLEIQSEPNMTTRQTSIRQIMNDTIDILEYYFNEDNLDQIFGFATTASHASLLHYLHLMVNFFKSYKVYFIDPYVSYIADDRNENNVQPIDSLVEHTDEYIKNDKAYVEDSYYMNEDYLKDDSALSQVVHEILDISQHYDPDPEDDMDYDGMTPADDGDNYKEADGRYPDDLSQFPYIMLNGGNPQLGMIGLWDLDGNSPKEQEVDYINIDGGHVFQPEDMREDFFGTKFKYVIDGGYPRFCESMVNGMHVIVEDHQIYSNVMISRQSGNKIEQRDDGIYVKSQWATHEEFEELFRDTTNMFNYYDNIFSTFSDDIHIISSEDLINARIVEEINEYIAPIPEVMEYEDPAVLDNMFHEIVDTRVDDLIEEFKDVSALGTWTQLEEV